MAIASFLNSLQKKLDFTFDVLPLLSVLNQIFLNFFRFFLNFEGAPQLFSNT